MQVKGQKDKMPIIFLVGKAKSQSFNWETHMDSQETEIGITRSAAAFFLNNLVRIIESRS